MSIAFPGTLPRPLQSGYTYSVAIPSVSTSNDRGLGRQRRMGAKPAITATLSWLFTLDQLVTFAGWWRNSIAYGATLASVQLLNGYTDAAQDVRFLGTYQEVENGGYWAVSVQVELISPPQASSGELSDAINNYADIACASTLHSVVHNNMWAKDQT